MKRLTAILFIMVIMMTTACGVLLAAENSVSVKASVSRYTANIGDRIRFIIEIWPYRGLEAALPDIKDGLIGDLEVKEERDVVRTSLFGKTVYSKVYELASFSVGKHTIPAISVMFRHKGSRDWTSESTEPVEITIDSVLPKDGVPDDIKEIKGPIHLYEIRWLLILAIAVAASAVIAGIIMVRNMMAKARILPPHTVALTELARIEEIFSKNADIKEYYVRISDSIRKYIERVFRLKAPEMTTEEFLASLNISSALNAARKESLKGFLNACDLVKFAKHAPTRREKDSIMASAKRFVEETKDGHL